MYKNFGASITGLEYAKLDYGPVPNCYDKILDYCIEKHLIQYQVEYEKAYECHKIKQIAKNDIAIFNKDELNTITKVKGYFQDYKSKDIVEFSHKEKGFIETEFYKNISYDYAFNIDL